MGCNGQYDEWIAEYALGDDVELTAAQQAELRAHLTICDTCRQDCRDTMTLFGLIRDEPEWEIPEGILRATHENVMRSIQQRTKQVALRRRFIWVSGALAASVLVVLGLWPGLPSPAHTPGATPPAIASTPASPPQRSNLPSPSAAPAVAEKTVSALHTAFQQALDPAMAFALLQAAFTAASESPQGGQFQEIISLCDRVISRWHDSPEALEARKLIARCYEQMAEPMQAHTAFVAYADEVGVQAAQRLVLTGANQEAANDEEARASAATIVAEAQRLFDAKDYTQALTYGDDLLSRYPHSEPAHYAQWMVGEYCLRTRQPAQAAATFKAIIAEAPDGPAARMAQIALPSALFKAGRQQEAVEIWQAYARHSTDTTEMACGYYNSAVLTATRGRAYYPQAMAMYKQVMADYPDTVYASLSKEAANRLSANFLNQMKILDKL